MGVREARLCDAACVSRRKKCAGLAHRLRLAPHAFQRKLGAGFACLVKAVTLPVKAGRKRCKMLAINYQHSTIHQLSQGRSSHFFSAGQGWTVTLSSWLPDPGILVAGRFEHDFKLPNGRSAFCPHSEERLRRLLLQNSDVESMFKNAMRQFNSTCLKYFDAGRFFP